MGDSKDGCIVDVVSGCKNGYSCILDICIVTYMHNCWVGHDFDSQIAASYGTKQGAP